MSDETHIGFLEKILGSNWRTSAWAIVGGVAAFVATYPELLAPIPDYWEDLIKKAIAFLIAGGIIKFGTSSADVQRSKEATRELRNEIEQIKYDKF